MTNLKTVLLSAMLRSRADDRSERGANLVEYTLLIGLIALVCIGAVALLGGTTEAPYSQLSSGIAD